MKTEQVNLRLEADLIAALERAAREESLDRGTMIRKLLVRGLSRRRLDRAMEQYQLGEISIGRAAEDAGVSHYEIMDEAERRGIAYPLDLAEVEAMLAAFPRPTPRVAESSPSYRERGGDGRGRMETLPDRAPRPGGILLVGINPAPRSVQGGHYYQGRLGKRLWQRLTRLGLLEHAVPGAEDDAFAAAGHGLTDIVKRPTRSASEVGREEIRQGLEALKENVRAWRPGLILFVFKKAAIAATGRASFPPGEGPAFEGVPTFLLSGPYAPRDLADRVNEELSRWVGAIPGRGADVASSQIVTPKDLESGIVRLPKDAKRFLPNTRSDVSIILRGTRLTVRYDPRLGPDQERSGVLRVGRDALSRLVKAGERLRVSRGGGGDVALD
jgi:TDG/mug DNA glycosylase family protein